MPQNLGLIPGQSERTAGAQGGTLLVVRLLLFPSHPYFWKCGRGVVTVPLPAGIRFASVASEPEQAVEGIPAQGRR